MPIKDQRPRENLSRRRNSRDVASYSLIPPCCQCVINGRSCLRVSFCKPAAASGAFTEGPGCACNLGLLGLSVGFAGAKVELSTRSVERIGGVTGAGLTSILVIMGRAVKNKHYKLTIR
jgi:hypothetical protein